MSLGFIHAVEYSTLSFLFKVDNIPLYGQTTFYVSSRLSVGTYTTSIFWLL